MIPKCKLNTNMKLIWSGNLYVTNSLQSLDEKLENNKLYIFVVRSLSGAYVEFIPYIYGSNKSFQHSYYDGNTVVRWRIDINSNGTEFRLSDGCLNMGNTTGVLAVYRVD